MWSERPDIIKVLFNISIDNFKYQFTQGMWFEESGMTNVLFDIQTNSRAYNTYCNKPKYGKDNFH